MEKPRAKRTLPGEGIGYATTPVDLFLLAGLPNPLNVRIEGWLRKLAGTAAKVVTVPSKGYDGPLYRDATIRSFLQAAGQFSVKRFRNQSVDAPPRPRRMTLFYVPASDDHQLLKAFDYFIFPVPLRELAEFDNQGRQKRHDRASCEQAITSALSLYARELITFIQPRIEGRSSTEQLLLPPRNFRLPQQAIESLFLELTRRTRLWENALTEVKPEVFGREQMPKFLHHRERRAMFRDARNIIFPCARSAQLHGRPSELGPDSEVSVFQDFLRSTYRFGIPLPDGFHHDAQLEWGSEFDRTSFDCSRKGSIEVSGSHVNIYPNDYIRADT